MAISEIRAKTDKELHVEVQKLKKEKMNLKFQKAANELQSTARMRSVRRDIARVKTVLNERNNKANV
jgi:large subunit ribosomal protein L29